MNDMLAQHVSAKVAEEHFLLGRAQEIFQQYYSSCFWHLRPDLRITAEHLPILRDGLRKYGGRRGFLLADELM
jgi:hypothetical protein